MNIIVCIKQVPDSTQVKVDPKTGTLIRAGVPSILNPYDHYALEKALAIKAKTGAKVTVLSMGPAQAVAVLRLALALGADEGVLLSDRAFAGSDTWATSYALATAVKKIGQFDMILCGQMAIDGDTAQTGPGIAYHLGIPQITFCESVDSDGTRAVVKKLIEGGHQIMEADLPVLITMTMPALEDAVRSAIATSTSIGKSRMSSQNAVRFHQAVADCIALGDAEGAEMAMRFHILHGLRDLEEQ